MGRGFMKVPGLSSTWRTLLFPIPEAELRKALAKELDAGIKNESRPFSDLCPP